MFAPQWLDATNDFDCDAMTLPRQELFDLDDMIDVVEFEYRSRISRTFLEEATNDDTD